MKVIKVIKGYKYKVKNELTEELWNILDQRTKGGIGDYYNYETNFFEAQDILDIDLGTFYKQKRIGRKSLIRLAKLQSKLSELSIEIIMPNELHHLFGLIESE